MAKQKRVKKIETGEREVQFKQKLVDLRRVTRIVAGGKRLRFRAAMVIGDLNGQVGFGVAKGADVAEAIAKAIRQAEKNLIKIPLVNGTLPQAGEDKYKTVHVLLKPAKPGHGLVAGGPVRIVLSLAGVKNITAKIIKGKNKINCLKAVFKILEQFRGQNLSI